MKGKTTLFSRHGWTKAKLGKDIECERLVISKIPRSSIDSSSPSASVKAVHIDGVWG